MDQLIGQLAAVDEGAPSQPSENSGHTARSQAEDSLLSAPHSFRFEGVLIGFKGRPRFGFVAESPSAVAEKIYGRYRSEGGSFVRDLFGPFALMIIDSGFRSAFIAIDRMGIFEMAWGLDGDRFVAGTSASEVALRLSKQAEVSAQAVFDFMLGHMVPAPASAFSAVNKLGRATALEYRDGKCQEYEYWQPDFGCRSASSNVRELQHAVLPTLRQAVDTTAPNSETGAFLSGGLDSSTIAGLLASSVEDNGGAFSVGFGVPEFDELDYARTVSRHFGLRHFEYEVTPEDIVRSIPEIAAAYDEPFGNSSAVPTLCCARLARKHGVKHLLAGDGGDELFAGNERYLKQQVFERYFLIPKALRRAVFEPLAFAFDPEHSLWPLRKFASYVRQASVPLPLRFETWNLVYRESNDSIFSSGFLSKVDTQLPLQRMREAYESCRSGDLLDRMLWYDWKFTLADNDLRKVNRMCELAGVEVSYPMLDERVVDLSVRVPSGQKMENGELRSFYKKATESFLPVETLTKQKHGFGLPFGQWLKGHEQLQELVYSSLDSLRDRGVFSDMFLRQVKSEHREGHPSYYGYAIWDLVLLEQWFQDKLERGFRLEGS